MDIGRPFELSTDLGFLYKSDEHERVFQETLKAIERREGLICITGEPGTGKTLLCERFLSEIDGGYQPVLLSRPLESPNGITEMLDKNIDASTGKIPIVIIDEAQDLSAEPLDEIKFLWNRSMANGDPLHIVLVGQPELAEAISSNGPLAQRVGANLSLGRLEPGEILPYLTCRLTKANLAGRVRFTNRAAKFIFRKTRGVPRLVNRIAQLAIERATAKGKSQIDALDIYRAGSGLPVLKAHSSRPIQKQRRLVLGSLGLLVAAILAVVLYGSSPSSYDKAGVSVERYGVKIGTFVTKEGAEQAARALQKDDFKVVVREQKLADGWVIYGVYLSQSLEKTQADRIVEVLHERYGLESSLVTLP